MVPSGIAFRAIVARVVSAPSGGTATTARDSSAPSRTRIAVSGSAAPSGARAAGDGEVARRDHDDAVPDGLAVDGDGQRLGGHLGVRSRATRSVARHRRHRPAGPSVRIMLRSEPRSPGPRHTTRCRTDRPRRSNRSASRPGSRTRLVRPSRRSRPFRPAGSTTAGRHSAKARQPTASGRRPGRSGPVRGRAGTRHRRPGRRPRRWREARLRRRARSRRPPSRGADDGRIDLDRAGVRLAVKAAARTSASGSASAAVRHVAPPRCPAPRPPARCAGGRTRPGAGT